ncbi:PH domain-containing protein [Cellulomonas fengjieae]|uniref:PH domain-containing protein n=1 Tax=Cellulomonas fengjieae TaxID=2819978 RepID=A0ABS3SBI3_9CELL|nr:PH domain-containing protein [Cellulomonas fengjieae]MBO3083111.1 PH domain-containing protein [Cellulomonas fengjieae]MBO3102142.1 PH domain-containing protein [Cellulomonas fengjieae]QVI65524.1 PH domain-containing protein [Cellulomonas fengjieae]
MTTPGTTPRPPRHQVDPRAVRYWFTSALITLVVVVVAAVVPALLWEAARPWFLGIGAVVVLLVLPRVVVAPWLRYRTHRWEATETAVYSRTGWWGRQWRIAPLSRVQTVEATRNPLHQAFGLAAVSVTTASAQGAIVIQGLDAAVADELVAALTTATEHTRGDAT